MYISTATDNTCKHNKSILGYLYCSSLSLRDESLLDAPGACFLILFRRIFGSSSSEVVRFILKAFADLLFLLCLLFLPLLLADLLDMTWVGFKETVGAAEVGAEDGLYVGEGVGGNGDMEGEDDGALDGGSVGSTRQLCNALFCSVAFTQHNGRYVKPSHPPGCLQQSLIAPSMVLFSPKLLQALSARHASSIPSLMLPLNAALSHDDIPKHELNTLLT